MVGVSQQDLLEAMNDLKNLITVKLQESSAISHNAFARSHNNVHGQSAPGARLCVLQVLPSELCWASALRRMQLQELTTCIITVTINMMQLQNRLAMATFCSMHAALAS